MSSQTSFLPYRLLALALFALLISFQIITAFNFPIWHDDATFATVAKNLVLGKGYAMVFFDTFAPFNHGITAGPVIILPAALIIALWGNAYWVPAITAILIIDALLIACYFQLKHILADRKLRWQCASLFLLSMMMVTN